MTRILVLVSMLLCSWPLPARADPMVCGLVVPMLKMLQQKFQEVPTIDAMLGNGDMRVIFVVAPSGTWTEIGVLAANHKVGCILQAGTGWPVIPSLGS